MAWRLAESLKVLRQQVNDRWPNRSKDSDGSIGDEGHSARTSDHNPNDAGVVCAIDITHDPKGGCDSYVFAEVLRAARDQRIKYIISNRKICSSETAPWQWRPYNGKNPHDHHIHISVKADRAHYDATGPWNLEVAPAAVAAHSDEPTAPPAGPTLRKGAEGDAVKRLQTLLVKQGIVVAVDGDFGDGTFAAVKRFQARALLVSDGIVGPQTWKALEK